MTDWPTLLLAVVAVSTGIMALVQIGMIIYGARLARRVDRVVDRVEQEIGPVLGKVQEISADAARATKLAVTQVERLDQVMARLARRVEETLDVAKVIVTPARLGLGLLDGLRAIFSADSKSADEQTSDAESQDKEADTDPFVG